MKFENNLYNISSISKNHSPKPLAIMPNFKEECKPTYQSPGNGSNPNIFKGSNVIIFRKKLESNIYSEDTLNFPLDISVSAFDAIIGSTLTYKQEHYINLLVKKIKFLVEVEDPILLAAKIKFYLLSSSHFRACRQDFAHKLEAIYVVVVHGFWKEIRG